MNDLSGYLPAKVMAFRRGDDDAVIDETVLAETTDIDDGEIEFAFDVPNPRRRMYVKFRIADLSAAIKPEDETELRA